jgi:tRNA pseudouridine32 synthase/23S rRNA pseudouridine746 synthase
MQSLGWPILNDKYYPVLEEQSADNFDKPLQLLAKELRFIDPLSQQTRCFCSPESLDLDAQA